MTLQVNDVQPHELYSEQSLKDRREILTALGYTDTDVHSKISKMLDQPYVSIDPSVAADAASRTVMVQEFEVKIRELRLEVKDLRDMEDARLFVIMENQGYLNAFERAELCDWLKSYIAKH